MDTGTVKSRGGSKNIEIGQAKQLVLSLSNDLASRGGGSVDILILIMTAT